MCVTYRDSVLLSAARHELLFICAQPPSSQAQAPVTKSASAPALDFFGKQKGTAKRKISEEEEKSSGNGKKVKKGAQGRGGQDAGVYGGGLKCHVVMCD